MILERTPMFRILDNERTTIFDSPMVSLGRKLVRIETYQYLNMWDKTGPCPTGTIGTLRCRQMAEKR